MRKGRKTGHRRSAVSLGQRSQTGAAHRRRTYAKSPTAVSAAVATASRDRPDPESVEPPVSSSPAVPVSSAVGSSAASAAAALKRCRRTASATIVPTARRSGTSRRRRPPRPDGAASVPARSSCRSSPDGDLSIEAIPVGQVGVDAHCKSPASAGPRRSVGPVGGGRRDSRHRRRPDEAYGMAYIPAGGHTGRQSVSQARARTPSLTNCPRPIVGASHVYGPSQAASPSRPGPVERGQPTRPAVGRAGHQGPPSHPCR